MNRMELALMSSVGTIALGLWTGPDWSTLPQEHLILTRTTECMGLLCINLAKLFLCF